MDIFYSFINPLKKAYNHLKAIPQPFVLVCAIILQNNCMCDAVVTVCINTDSSDVQEHHQRSSATLNICDMPWNGRPSVLLWLFTAQWGLKMNTVIDVTVGSILSPAPTQQTSSLSRLGPQRQLEYRRRRKWVLKLKSHTDDNETVLGRNILVRINSLIHLIRPPWSITHSFEWIQVIRLELLPWNGNAPLGTKSTH